jgi:hypothetical protein
MVVAKNNKTIVKVLMISMLVIANEAKQSLKRSEKL